jgi:hypothetical protein
MHLLSFPESLGDYPRARHIRILHKKRLNDVTYPWERQVERVRIIRPFSQSQILQRLCADFSRCVAVAVAC